MTQLSTLDLTPEESFDLWREVTRGTYELAVPNCEPRCMRLTAEMHTTPSLTLSHFSCQRNQKWRDDMHLANDGRPYVKLRRYLNGGATVVAEGHYFRLHPGTTYLLDQSRASTELSTDNQQMNVFVPHDMIGFDPSVHAVVTEWPDPSPRGTIVLAALNQLWEDAFNPAATDRISAEREFCRVLRDVLLGASDSFDSESIRRSRFRAIKTEIDRRLIAAQDSTVDDIVRSLPFSRASLYRHFAGQGGISNYLRKRRMALAYLDLCHQEQRRGAVETAAYRFGYSSIHSFSKAFKRELGYSPREVVGTRTSHSDESLAQKFPESWADGALAFVDAFKRIRAA